ncbi:MAG: hypothetical protein KC609_16155 [Myxococcales bacterium]|nr:hypothetical protein [Myxococcales bacterium]
MRGRTRRLFVGLILALALIGVSGIASADVRIVPIHKKKKTKKTKKKTKKIKKKKKPAKVEKKASLSRDAKLWTGLGAGTLLFGLGLFGSWRVRRREDGQIG